MTPTSEKLKALCELHLKRYGDRLAAAQRGEPGYRANELTLPEQAHKWLRHPRACYIAVSFTEKDWVMPLVMLTRDLGDGDATTGPVERSPR